MVDIVRELEDFGIAVQLHDPMADSDLLREEYDLSLTPLGELKPADAVVLAVAHRTYRDDGWKLMSRLLHPTGGFVADIPALLDRQSDPGRRDALAALAPARPTSAASVPSLPTSRRPAVKLPSAPLVAGTNTLAPTLASALSPGTKVTIGVPGFTLMVCVPSLYLRVSVWPSGAVATVATVALVIMLSGCRSHG